MRGNIQRLKVVIVVFNFRALYHDKAESVKKTFNTLHGLCYGMKASELAASTWQGNIKLMGRQFLRLFSFCQKSLFTVQLFLNQLFCLIDGCSSSGSFFTRQISQSF